MNKKCDVIIPIYNAPDWVKLCVYAVIKNTPSEYLNKIYLMNDNSNKKTLDTLISLEKKYDKVVLITNENNLGFVKNCNKALDMVEAPYTLLLNSDCLVSKNTISKLVDHMENDHEIGLICPVSSNAANLTLPMFEGFSYTQMDALLERKFKGKLFDACTIVGNCLMISKRCLDTVGKLDEIYGMGYGEETDYQFQCMAKGFTAKVAIDTYVFHKAEVSFGISKEKQEKVNRNREIFFGRWGDQYNKLAKEYEKNDPIKYILDNLTVDDKNISIETAIYLPDIVQNAGGCHVVVDMVNYLSINGYDANIIYDQIHDYDEVMLFTPISALNFNNITCKQIMSTIWASTFKAKKFAESKNIPLISFVQGYEGYFTNASEYGSVAVSYKLADDILTISNYLNKKLKDVFNIDSSIVKNGVNVDLLCHENKNDKAENITLFLRDNTMKGDFLLIDLMNILNTKYSGLTINVIYVSSNVVFPYLVDNGNTINYIKGPIARNKMSDIMNCTDIYVDCSLNEGFGLLAMESICAGAVPVVSQSFGINEYVINGNNGFIINEVNDVDKYVEKIDLLINSPELFNTMKNNQTYVIQNFDYDKVVEQMISFLSKERKIESTVLEGDEIEILKHNLERFNFKGKKSLRIKRFVYAIARRIPKKMKNKIKPIITTLYNMYNHD